MVKSIKQKDASHVRLIFPATWLDSGAREGLGIAPSSAVSPAAVAPAHIGYMFGKPKGADEEAKLPGMDKVKRLTVTFCKFIGLATLFVPLLLAASLTLAFAIDDSLKNILQKPFDLDLGNKPFEGALEQGGHIQTPRVTTPAKAKAITLHQLYIAAPPKKSQTLDWLRQQAAEEYHWLDYYRWIIFINGLNVVLSAREATPTAEEAVQEAREHLRKYLDALRQIDEINGVREAREIYRQRLQNIIINRNPRYEVEIGNTTIRNYPTEAKPDSTTQNQPSKKWKEETYLKIEKVPKDAGFDKEGKPYRVWVYDVVRKKRRVPDN